MQLINILPCIHVVNKAGHLVAAAFSRVRSLRGIGIPLQDVDSRDVTEVWQPSDDETRIHGVVEAKRRFHTAISDSAAEAAISGCPEGLIRFYRMNAETKCLVRMEWERLIKDIQVRSRRWPACLK